MKIDAILDRVEKSRKTGRDSWVCCCPAHPDKNPSMTLRELDDGRVLLHCFAGCEVEAILGALGLSFDALFPDKPLEHGKPLRRPFPAADVLECLEFEAFVVCVAASSMSDFGPMDDEMRDRLTLARERIEVGRDLALGERRPFG